MTDAAGCTRCGADLGGRAVCPSCGLLQPAAPATPTDPEDADPTGPSPTAAPAGFPPLRPPAPAAPGAGFAGRAVPPTIAPLPREPVRRPPPKKSKGPLILVMLAVLAAGALIVVVKNGLESSDDAKDTATKTFVSTTIAPNEDNDPKIVEFVRDYCSITDRSLAEQVPAYEPGEPAYTSVYFKQAIGAPGLRTGWFLLPTSPEVGAPMDAEEFAAVDATDVRLATCLEIGPGVPTSINCTYTQTNPNLPPGDQFTTLFQTPYVVKVYEIHTGEVIATGEVKTNGEECPAEALVELSDNVSGPMDERIIAAWFDDHFEDGAPTS